MEGNASRTLRQRPVRLDALPHIAPTATDTQGVEQPHPAPLNVITGVAEAAQHIRAIDHHFLRLYQILTRVQPIIPRALEDTAEYEQKLTDMFQRQRTAAERWGNDQQGALDELLKIASECLFNNRLMLGYWVPAIGHAMNPNHGIVTSTGSIQWKVWIRELDVVSSPLSDTINIPPKLIEQNTIRDLISKVEFLDDLLDGEFAKLEMGLGKRNVHLGETINRKTIERIGSNPGFVERRPIVVATSDMTEGYPTVRAIVLFTTLLGIIPGYLAWGSALHVRGTTHDADFWSLIQGLVMQVQNNVVIIASIWTRKDLSFKGWFWTWVFLCLSCLCPIAAAVLYVYVPTEWSAAVMFLGTTAQGFIILQSSFTKAKGKEKVA